MNKQFFTTTLLAGLLAVGFTSCKKDEIRTTAEFSATPTLSSNATNAGVLLPANRPNTAVTYTWTPYTYKLSDNTTSASPVVYTLQFALAGTDFAKPYELAAGTADASSLKVTVGQLNAVLISLKAPLNQVSRLEVRLKTFAANNLPLIYSAVSTISATPFDECVAPTADTWSLIGPAGVDWNTDVALVWNCTDNAYVATRALNADEFKFRRNNDWGTNLGASGSTVATLTDNSPSSLGSGNQPNLKIATAGTYKIKLQVSGTSTAPTGTVTIIKQ